eukprot:COSAG05_NODE_18891_length_301_cov_0.707921_1_plen_25_part_10
MSHIDGIRTALNCDVLPQQQIAKVL